MKEWLWNYLQIWIIFVESTIWGIKTSKLSMWIPWKGWKSWGSLWVVQCGWKVKEYNYRNLQRSNKKWRIFLIILLVSSWVDWWLKKWLQMPKNAIMKQYNSRILCLRLPKTLQVHWGRMKGIKYIRNMTAEDYKVISRLKRHRRKNIHSISKLNSKQK